MGTAGKQWPSLGLLLVRSGSIYENRLEGMACIICGRERIFFATRRILRGAGLKPGRRCAPCGYIL